MLEVCRCFWMCSASSIRLFVRLGSTCFTMASSQFTWCPVSQACTAIPFTFNLEEGFFTFTTEEKGVVYEVPTANAIKCMWVGETRRTLQKRLCEHRAGVKKNDQKNHHKSGLVPPPDPVMTFPRYLTALL